MALYDLLLTWWWKLSPITTSITRLKSRFASTCLLAYGLFGCLIPPRVPCASIVPTAAKREYPSLDNSTEKTCCQRSPSRSPNSFRLHQTKRDSRRKASQHLKQPPEPRRLFVCR